MFILFYYITYEKQVFMDSLNYHIKWHRQLKHTMRLNLFILLPWDKKVQKECARKTEVQQNYGQWVVWSQIYMRFWLHLCNMQPAFPHWCKQSKKMGLGKQEVVLAVHVINLLRPKHTPGSDGGWKQGIRGQEVASTGWLPHTSALWGNQPAWEHPREATYFHRNHWYSPRRSPPPSGTKCSRTAKLS